MSHNMQAGWFALAAGVLLAAALSFGPSPASSQTEPQRAIAAPAIVAVHVRLDDGLDWSNVAAADNVVPLAIAAYER